MRLSIAQGTYRLYTSLGPYRIFMHLYVPWAIQVNMHLYVPWAIYDFHASIPPLGHIGFTCIYTSLGPYRIFRHLYVPWAIQDLHASIRPQGASGGQYGLIVFSNFILYEGCITVGGVYIYIFSIHLVYIQYRYGIDIVCTSTYCTSGWPAMLSMPMPKDLPSAFRSHILRPQHSILKC